MLKIFSFLYVIKRGGVNSEKMYVEILKFSTAINGTMEDFPL